VQARYHDHPKAVFRVFEEKLRGSPGYRLAFVYTNLLDTLGHLCWYKNRRELIRGYRLVNLMVWRLLRRARADVTLVVSDHGMRGSPDGVTGTHSEHMFWSLNVDAEIRSVYDIPRMVVEWCRS
jgi:hypothetical protein